MAINGSGTVNTIPKFVTNPTTSSDSFMLMLRRI